MVEEEAKTVANDKKNIDASKYDMVFDFVKTPITKVADDVIIAASNKGSSDIHFDPREDGMVIRFRIDGELQDYTFIPKTYERNLTTRLKLMANMNITESRLPQDGAIKGDFGGKYLDMRVSCLPLNEGEKVVIRILDYTRSLQGIDSLGFNKVNLEKLKRMMGVPNGIILVTGATGSGKSTTTYSILQGLNKPEVNIITVEDPIEMNIEGMNQVQVNSEIGMTFAAALRSILRQDPNVILIGEIRDSETAQIAVRASITGHLVLSTIHTNNSLATIERLLDMDVERYLLSTALTGIISQRLAKQLCIYCRTKRATTKYEQKVFKRYMNLDVEEIYDANEDGCEHCRKGYKGRIAIQEVLELDEEIRNALTNDKLKKEDLKAMVYTNKTITMLQDALGKALAGLTSFSEVYRVIEIESDWDEAETHITNSLDEEPDETATDNIVSKTTDISLGGDEEKQIDPTIPAADTIKPVAVNPAEETTTTEEQPTSEPVTNYEQQVSEKTPPEGQVEQSVQTNYMPTEGQTEQNVQPSDMATENQFAQEQQSVQTGGTMTEDQVQTSQGVNIPEGQYANVENANMTNTQNSEMFNNINPTETEYSPESAVPSEITNQQYNNDITSNQTNEYGYYQTPGATQPTIPQATIPQTMPQQQQQSILNIDQPITSVLLPPTEPIPIAIVSSVNEQKSPEQPSKEETTSDENYQDYAMPEEKTTEEQPVNEEKNEETPIENPNLNNLLENISQQMTDALQKVVDQPQYYIPKIVANIPLNENEKLMYYNKGNNKNTIDNQAKKFEGFVLPPIIPVNSNENDNSK